MGILTSQILYLSPRNKVSFIRSPGTAERTLKWGGGGAENERRRRELVGGSGKILKSRVSEIVFTAFSARHFLK